MNKLISLAIIGLVLFSLSTGCYNPFDQSDIKLSITGKAVDQDGKPLGDVLVRTDPMTTIQKTNSDGVYTINEVTPGKYKLKASKPGYKTTEYEIEARSSVFVCQSAKMTKDIMLEQQPEGEKTGEIYGTVKDKDGKAVKDVTITTDPATSEIKSDTVGVFLLSDIKAGLYTVKASKDGYNNALQDNVTVEGGKRTEVSLFVFTSTQLGKISGKVISSSGIAIEGVTITTNPTTSTKTTDTSGNYEITSVGAMQYTITAVKTGYDTTTKNVTVNVGETADGNITMNVATEGTNKGVIRGKISDSGGTGIQSVTITTSPATSTKTTDASGNYEIADVNPGNYTITASKTGYDTGTKNVTVMEGSQANGDITMTITVYNPNQWIQLSPSGTPPSTRYYPRVIWDSQNNRMLLFGGYLYKNDLWSYDPNSNTWSQITPVGTPPAGRFYHSAMWDPQNNRMLVFAGSDGSNTLNDFWCYTLSTNTWSQMSAVGTPPSARTEHSATWDPQNNRMIVFAGYDGPCKNDLWSYTPSTNTWLEITPSGTPPSARFGHSAIWDSQNNRMLVFGGNSASNGSAPQNDLWNYVPSTNTWSQMTPIGTPPSVRNDHSAIWDSLNNRMIVFGGSPYLNDLWSYTPSTNAWVMITPIGTPPSARYSHGAVWDTQNNGMLVFSGYDGSPKNDLWSYK